MADRWKNKIIECFDLKGKKQCDLYPDEMTAEELAAALEIQAYQGRVCLERQTGG